jgi:putrescine:ornithine antiporter
MGSIIMLPTNMAKVGDLAAVVDLTAVGSMGIAWLRARGVQPARGGIGVRGGCVAVRGHRSSACISCRWRSASPCDGGGYLASFIPWFSSTPITTHRRDCVALLTTIANFGGPTITGRIGSVSVWGVILPVGLLSVVGWLWFKPDLRCHGIRRDFRSARHWLEHRADRSGRFSAWSRRRRTPRC